MPVLITCMCVSMTVLCIAYVVSVFYSHVTGDDKYLQYVRKASFVIVTLWTLFFIVVFCALQLS